MSQIHPTCMITPHIGVFYDADTGLLICNNGPTDLRATVSLKVIGKLARAIANEDRKRRRALTHNSAGRRCGAFPIRLDTITATVLAHMLDGGTFTSLDAVIGASTTRLAGTIFRLKQSWGWTIEREEFDQLCVDGHVAHGVVRYSLSDEVIEAAKAAGAEEWVKKVHKTHAQLRRKKSSVR